MRAHARSAGSARGNNRSEGASLAPRLMLGAALIERDLLHEKIALLEAHRPLAGKRRAPCARPSHRSVAAGMGWPQYAGSGASPGRIRVAGITWWPSPLSRGALMAHPTSQLQGPARW